MFARTENPIGLRTNVSSEYQKRVCVCVCLYELKCAIALAFTETFANVKGEKVDFFLTWREREWRVWFRVYGLVGRSSAYIHMFCYRNVVVMFSDVRACARKSKRHTIHKWLFAGWRLKVAFDLVWTVLFHLLVWLRSSLQLNRTYFVDSILTVISFVVLHGKCAFIHIHHWSYGFPQRCGRVLPYLFLFNSLSFFFVLFLLFHSSFLFYFFSSSELCVIIFSSFIMMHAIQCAFIAEYGVFNVYFAFMIDAMEAVLLLHYIMKNNALQPTD